MNNYNPGYFGDGSNACTDNFEFTTPFTIPPSSVRNIGDALLEKNDLWKNTAILITIDEGGGYYDSGYVQALDFFGDGTRIPMIAISKFTQAGHITTSRSSNSASTTGGSPRSPDAAATICRIRNTTRFGSYAPVNSPAIGDLFDLLKFGGDHDH